MATLDPTNIAILNLLRDGRRPYSEIASELDLSENTVRSRVNRLQEDGILSFTGLIDPDEVGGAQVIYVGVKLDAMDLSRKAEELSRLPGVVSAAVVTGRFDVILTALLTTRFGLLTFFADEVSRVDGIRSVETFVVYRGYNLRVPMMHGEIA